MINPAALYFVATSETDPALANYAAQAMPPATGSGRRTVLRLRLAVTTIGGLLLTLAGLLALG